MLARKERRQDADLPRYPMRALAARQAQRSDRASGDQRAELITAADRAQPRDELNLLARSEIDYVRAGLGAGTRCPGVADLSAETPAVGVLHHQHRIDGLTEPGSGLAKSAADQSARTGGQ